MQLAGAFPRGHGSREEVVRYLQERTVLSIIHKGDLVLLARNLWGLLEKLRSCSSCMSNALCAQRCLGACCGVLADFKAHYLRLQRLRALFTDERGMGALVRATSYWSRVEILQEFLARRAQGSLERTDMVMADRLTGQVYYIEFKKNPVESDITKDQTKLRRLLNDEEVSAPGNLRPPMASRVGYQVIFCSQRNEDDSASETPISKYCKTYTADKWTCQTNLNKDIRPLGVYNISCYILKVESS
ncbi:hypothetical protein NDU88_007537 [Pleurodeles waltl]|uniref:Uncharacterized protein n=1 Tax=Pleurodeles waltl TaxID=8319 RepID=A0AAV7MGQ5_PLEWA|nr:hypothetical protein NDU88_007537 [Pleurodeles waltl]